MKKIASIVSLSALILLQCSCETGNVASTREYRNAYYERTENYRWDNSNSLRSQMLQQDKEREKRRIAELNQGCKYKDGGYASGAVYHPGNIPCCKTK